MLRSKLNYFVTNIWSTRQLLIRQIYGSQNRYSEMSFNKHEDEDISEDVINITKRAMKDTQIEDRIKLLVAHASLSLNLKHVFNCSEDVANRMISQDRKLLYIDNTTLAENIENLFEHEISSKSIIENPWLLSAKRDIMHKKIIRLKSLNYRNINDFVPFLQLSATALIRTSKLIEREKNIIPYGNRVYFLAKRLNLEPSLVARYFATHMFMFEISYEMLLENLAIMQEYKIESINILKDLWAFKYLPKLIRDRLEKCRQAGKENLKPWMIRCPEDVLDKTLKICQDQKNLLGNKTMVDYLAERLDTDVETIHNCVLRHPNVLKCRGPKVKEMLDYLIDEEKFSKLEVAKVIRIVTHSLETTKRRISELKAVGCRPSTLTILCKSKREYEKFLKEWLDREDKK